MVQQTITKTSASPPVSQPGDRWEREADRMAERALEGAAPSPLARVATPPPPLLRKCAQCEEKAEEEKEDDAPIVSRKTNAGATGAIDPSRALASISGGAPLPRPVREFFEPRFDFDFSRVRIHTGARANEAARSLGARAFTRGRDIVFAEGTFAPETGEGRALLAHELAHVVQAERSPDRVYRQIEERAEPEARSFLVEDDAIDLSPGQMKKTEFLELVETRACAAADERLRAVGRDTEGCPFVARWMEHYRNQSAEHVERAVRRYAPEARRATSAAEYVPFVVDRVRAGVDRWIETGELPELPDGIGLFSGGLMGLLGGIVGGLTSLFFKRESGPPHALAPRLATERALGPGAPLDQPTRARMERAFGTDFGSVRIHTGEGAAALSQKHSALALTAGRDIAFASGAYRPGTLEGDALLAHELAHVVQQEGATQLASGDSLALEADADQAAAKVMLALWRGAKGSALPALRSGLRVQRCSSPRTSPISAAEADRFIRGEFGDTLGRDRENRAQLAEYRIVPDTEFERAQCINNCWLPNRPADAPAPADCQTACEAQTTFERTSTLAFVDRRPSLRRPIVWIRHSAHRAVIVLHESIHLYMHPSLMGSKCIGDFHEGVTEYFTRKIARQHNLATESVAYDAMAEGIAKFARTLGGDEMFERWYVRGDWSALRDPINARTNNHWPQWRCQLALAASLRNNPEHYDRLNELLTRWDDQKVSSFCREPSPDCT